ncbi:hypothetical protein MHB78_05205 [Bacillus sp. FSL K6-0138]|uniref:hypothetical protein n=1 Tax=Bacillus sp. FSL K6-0138 TaxID=2921422 RepID=UPI0030EC2A1F
MSSVINCKVVEPVSDHVRAIYTVDQQIKLEVRLTFPAILNENSGLGGKAAFDELFVKQIENTAVYQWLCEIGEQLLRQVKEPEIVNIEDSNVKNRNLKTSWEELRREPLDINNIPL